MAENDLDGVVDAVTRAVRLYCEQRGLSIDSEECRAAMVRAIDIVASGPVPAEEIVRRISDLN